MKLNIEVNAVNKMNHTQRCLEDQITHCKVLCLVGGTWYWNQEQTSLRPVLHRHQLLESAQFLPMVDTWRLSPKPLQTCPSQWQFFFACWRKNSNSQGSLQTPKITRLARINLSHFESAQISQLRIWALLSKVSVALSGCAKGSMS